MSEFKTLSYEGSVKTVYRDTADPQVNYFAFTDDYSVFDWGKMPDAIANKGRALSILGGTLFSRLSQPETWQKLKNQASLSPFRPDFRDKLFASRTFETLTQNGLKHHYLGWVNYQGKALTAGALLDTAETPLMKVRSIGVNRPQAFYVGQHTLYRYPQPSIQAQPFLIPLEVIFRFGMPEGSSLKKRLDRNPHYAAELGLTEQPAENQWFERPVVEFFTKLEPEDRFLSVQEAYLISGLSEEQFTSLYETTLLLSLWLYDCFAQKGIELWDGKFEFAATQEGLILVDSIGPDELRLKYQGVHLSKEVIRKFYRESCWEKAVKEAKALASTQPGSDWKALCQHQLGESPKPLSSGEKQLVDNLYATLVNYLLDRDYIPATMGFNEVVLALSQETPVGAR